MNPSLFHDTFTENVKVSNDKELGNLLSPNLKAQVEKKQHKLLGTDTNKTGHKQLFTQKWPLSYLILFLYEKIKVGND